MEIQQYPDDFRCPISMEVMSDPVILSSGHTFDRTSIQRWLDSGNRTCPVTNLPLPPHPSLIPNHALRSLISNFTPTPPSNSIPCPLSFLKTLTSKSPSSKLESLAQIPRISRHLPSFRRQLIESGAASAVLRLVPQEDLAEAALKVVLDLSLDGDDARVGLVAEGAVATLVEALDGKSPAARALAATALTSLAVVEHALGTLVSVCTYSDRLRLDACREGVLEACLELVGDENAKIAKNALKLIKMLQR
ncbi:U-box domain-containing protein 8 [Acorus calamus]|uniref:RING-type E3 ubiquitin transferase n=1 Tax=Acorus calamus TaxID=4465 RepID=A0AAV9DRX8_ACOCL|nr:U-box domain-containing protein 8 [Acorus calamus]